MIEFVCSKKLLSDALGITARAVKPKGPLPVLQCVRVTALADAGSVRLYATDYETAIETQIVAEVTESFDIALPAKQFSEIVHAMPDGDLKVRLTDAGNVIFQSRKATMRMTGVLPEDMVTLPPVNDELGLILPEGMLRCIIAKVVFAAATDDTQTRLCGSNLVLRDNYVEMAATDTKVLSVYRQLFDGEIGRTLSVIVPRQTQLDLLKLLKENGEADVTVRVDDVQISFQIEGRFLLVSRLIGGDYLNYGRFAPKDTRVSVTVDRELLVDAFKRLSIAARDDSHRIFCEFSGATLSLRARSSGGECEAEEELQIGLEGGPISNVLHAQQVLSVLNAFECDEIRMGLEDPMRPVLFLPDDSSEYYAVVLPMHPV